MTTSRHAHGTRWSPSDRRRLLDLLREGWPVPDIAEQLGRSPDSIYEQVDALGTTIQAIRQSEIAVRSITAVASLFGVQRRVVQRWILNRWLTVRRNRSRRKGISRHYLITDTALIRMVENPSSWIGWSIERITDPDWKSYATQVRQPELLAPRERLYTVAQIANKLLYSKRTALGWVQRGLLRATKIGGVYYVRAEDLADFIPPIEKRGQDDG